MYYLGWCRRSKHHLPEVEHALSIYVGDIDVVGRSTVKPSMEAVENVADTPSIRINVRLGRKVDNNTGKCVLLRSTQSQSIQMSRSLTSPVVTYVTEIYGS